MDPVSQLGHSAYHALCLALAAQNDEKLWAPDTDLLLEEAREILGISEKEDTDIRKQADRDPMVLALRQGQAPPGGLRLPGAGVAAAAPPAWTASQPPSMPAPQYGAMPPPAPALAPPPYDSPFGQPGMQTAPSKKGKKETVVPVAAPAPTAKGSALIGRKLQRYFPDCSPSWVTGTIIAYNPTSGEHQVQYGPPVKIAIWENINEMPPQNFRWVESAPEPPAPPPATKAGGSSKAGGGSKSGLKSQPSTPKAPAAPKAPPPALPVNINLPGGPSTFMAVGMSILAPPYNDSFLRTNLPKNRPEDLFAMLGAMDEREAAVVREITSLLDDQADIDEITRLLEQSQQLGRQEQQLRAELRELGVTG